MKKFEELLKKILEEHNNHIESNVHTFSGMISRIRNKYEYWKSFLTRELSISIHNITWLDDYLKTEKITREELIELKLALKNYNSKLLNRSNYILIAITVITLAIFSPLNALAFSQQPEVVFFLQFTTFLLIVGAATDRVNVNRKIQENEFCIHLLETKV